MPVLVSGKFVFAPNVDGGLDAAERTGAEADAPSSGGSEKARRSSPLVPDFDPGGGRQGPGHRDAVPGIPAGARHDRRQAGRAGDRRQEDALPARRRLSRYLRGPGRARAGPPGPAGSTEGKFLPLASDFDVRTVTAKAGTEQTLTEEQVALVLAGLAKTAGGRRLRLHLRRPAVPARQGRRSRSPARTRPPDP